MRLQEDRENRFHRAPFGDSIVKPVSYKSTEDAANAILKILREEEQELAAVLKIEKTERRPKSNRMMVSLKKGGQTFRITFDWVRDEHIAYHGFHLGNGYIEKEWDLALRPEKEAVPVSRLFSGKCAYTVRPSGKGLIPKS